MKAQRDGLATGGRKATAQSNHRAQAKASSQDHSQQQTKDSSRGVTPANLKCRVQKITDSLDLER